LIFIIGGEMNLTNLRKIISFYSLIGKRRLIPILIGGFLATSSVVFGFFIPLLVRNIIDGLTINMQMEWNSIYLLAILYTTSFILTYIGDQIYLREKFKAAADLSNRIFKLSFFFPWKKLKQQGSAYYASLINNQLNEAFVVLDYGFIRNIFVLIRMVLILVMVFAWSKFFFFLYVVNVAIVGLYTNIIDRVSHRPYSRGYELMRQATNFIVETFENLHEIFAGEAKSKRENEYERIYQKITDSVVEAEIPRSRFDKLMVDLPDYFSRLIILVYGSFLVINGRMTVGTIWALWTYFSFVTEPLYLFRELARIAVRVSANLDTILNYFDEAEHAQKNYTKHEIFPVPKAPVYSLKDVSFGFEPDKPFLKKISLNVQHGETIAIVGLSGEGKSTLLNILLGLEQNYEGEVKLLGNELKGTYPLAVFKYVGYYSQTVGIFNETLESNIVMGRKLDEERLEKVIDDLKLDHLKGRLLGEGGSFVSGGEKQRIQLARLFYAEKDVVVVDEPLTNLDTINESILLEKLEDYLSTRSGIIISHKPNVISLANRVFVLKNGTVAATGSFSELMSGDDTFKGIIESYLSSANEIGRKKMG